MPLKKTPAHSTLAKNTLAKDFPEWSSRLLKKNKDLFLIVQIIAGKVALMPCRYPENPPKVRIVGGFVRDALLGIDSLDIDVEVYGTDPLELYAVLQDTFPGQLRLLGKSYEVLQIKTHDLCKIEVNMPRHDEWKEDRSTFFSSDPRKTPEKSILSKEFICNSAQADPLTGTIFDPLNAKKEFLESRLEVLDERNFFFNPLCVFRVLHFATRFKLIPTFRTLSTIKEVINRDLLKNIHPRRIADELEKVLHLEKPASLAMSIMLQSGIIADIFPVLYDQKRPDYASLWKTTLKRVDNVQNYLVSSGTVKDATIANRLLYSALLFDVLKSDFLQVKDTMDKKINPIEKKYGENKHAEAIVRRKTQEFFKYLQFEHPTLKRDFPKLMLSLILADELVRNLNSSQRPPHVNAPPRKERLKPRSKNNLSQHDTGITDNSVRGLESRIRPFTIGYVLSVYETIFKYSNDKLSSTDLLREGSSKARICLPITSKIS
jgi:tRNA nucleotidyltransferase/poly(A) polymerase